MIRLFLRLVGIKDFEVCQSCQTLKEQLLYEREEKKHLTETLLQIISPKVIEQPVVELNPIVNSTGPFSRRRAALEAKDREEARIKNQSTNLGQPDDKLKEINDLEKELGVEGVAI
jgi:tRNA/tmRNA/rRNA uracil-C5-methylase (TrmA/RlmC/RlmD family)